jgi:hypothetical protein
MVGVYVFRELCIKKAWRWSNEGGFVKEKNTVLTD